MKKVFTFLVFLAISVSVWAQQSSRDALFFKSLSAPYLMKGGFIDAHWMTDGDSFWWTENGQVWKFDPVSGRKTPLIDMGRAPKALTPTAKPRLIHNGLLALVPPTYEQVSPDGKWLAGTSQGELYVRSAAGGAEVVLAHDVTKDNDWEADSIVWSPDSKSIVASRVDRRKVPLYPIIHWLGQTESVQNVRLPRTGQPVEVADSFVFEVGTRHRTHIESVQPMGWHGDEMVGLRFGDKKLDLVGVDRRSGKSRTIFTETARSFFDLSLSIPGSPNLSVLPGSDGFLWLSERDGWNQIYLYDWNGRLVRHLTTEHRPVLRVEAVDEKAGWVYYTAYGGEGRPYDIQLYRVRIGGGESERLTEAPGQHGVAIYLSYIGEGRGEGIQFSPSKRFFLDSHSDVDRAPETDLRSADGKLVAVLSKADPAPVLAIRPHAPEPFSAKAADGQTDLYGIVYKPADFDPAKHYPVVDAIYAGPQTTWVSWNFAGPNGNFAQAVANLGFVVVTLDARGTPNRGKAFQDVVYMRFGEDEIPDHVAAIKELARTRSFMDLSRVGVFGGSFGGYFTVRAMLQAPDFFKVGVSLAPATDLRDLDPSMTMYMGDPVENKLGYDRASNVSLAKDLKGRLLLIHGTADLNAPLTETMRMIDAFVKAGKPYDLILLPEQTHVPAGASMTYYILALKRYLTEHLRP